MPDNILKNRLKLLIKASGLSQSEIARRVGVTRGSVGHWLNNGNISRENLLSLCHILQVSLTDLVDDTTYLHLEPLQIKVIQLTKELPKEEYYKLEDVIRLLEGTEEVK